MPGIQITIFREQVERLLLAFTRPTDFLQQLRGIFERYGLPAYHASDQKQNLPEPAYHLPALVLREIEIHIQPLCENNPGAALRLSSALAQDRYAEIRLLAADLLGFTPAAESTVVMNAIRQLCDGEESFLMRREYVTRGSLSLRRSAGDIWLDWIEQRLHASSLDEQRTGLLSVFSIIEDQGFENLPPVFRLLEPFLLTVKREQENLLRFLLEALAKRTAVETAYYLYEIAPYSTQDRSQRLIRSCLPFFSEELQQLIRRGLNRSEIVE